MKSYLGCTHDQISVDEEEIVKPNCDSFNFLIDDICADLRLKQLNRAARISSFALKSYHSIAIFYKPKRYHL